MRNYAIDGSYIHLFFYQNYYYNTTMSFTTNVRLNNLQRQINELESSVSDIIASGTGTITSDIDMNNNDIVDLKSVVFNDTVSTNNNTLASTNDALLFNGDPVLFSPLTTNLDCGNHNLSNVGQITIGGITLAEYQGGLAVTDTLILGNNSVTGINNVQCTTLDLNNGQVRWDGTNLKIQGNTIITNDNIDGYIDTDVNFEKLTVGTSPNQYTLAVNPDNNLALYTGSVVQPSSLVGEVAYVSPENGVTTEIVNFTDIADSGNHHLMLSDTAPYLLQFEGATILTSSNAKVTSLVLLDNTTEHSLNFDGTLKIDSDEIITSTNIESYVENVTDLHLYTKKVADVDQDMNNHNIENVNSITWNGANADSLVIQSNKLQFSDGTQIKRFHKQVYNIASNSSNSIQTIPLEFLTETITNYCIVTITGIVMCIGTLTGSYTNSASTKYVIVAKAGSDAMFTILNETQETEFSSTYTVNGSPKQDEITFENSTSDYQVNMKYDYYSDPAQTIVNTYEVQYCIV